MCMASAFELEWKPYFRSDLQCDKNKWKKTQKQQIRGNFSHPLNFLRPNAGPVTLESWQKAACLNGAANSIPPDLGMRVGFNQPREKNVNICLSLHGQWPIIIFFPASLSCSQTKTLSSQLCCPCHFPPLLHLWYANGKTELFCVAEKDLWAHSLGQQSQLLWWGSACCARTQCQGTSLPSASPLKKNQNTTK